MIKEFVLTRKAVRIEFIKRMIKYSFKYYWWMIAIEIGFILISFVKLISSIAEGAVSSYGILLCVVGVAALILGVSRFIRKIHTTLNVSFGNGDVKNIKIEFTDERLIMSSSVNQVDYSNVYEYSTITEIENTKNYLIIVFNKYAFLQIPQNVLSFDEISYIKNKAINLIKK